MQDKGQVRAPESTESTVNTSVHYSDVYHAHLPYFTVNIRCGLRQVGVKPPPYIVYLYLHLCNRYYGVLHCHYVTHDVT